MQQNEATPLASAVYKIKCRVLPLFVVLFIGNYVDRVNVGFVKDHLKTDLGIDAAAFGFGAGLFFAGYAILEVPSNMLLQRVGARAWITRITVSWGIVAALMALIKTETHFYALRFLLGAAEAGFFPGVVYYFTRWLPNQECGKAMALFLSGSAIASIISGPLTGTLLQFNLFGLKGWQSMFIIEGVASVLMGALVWFFLDSHPQDARWLTDDEKNALTSTIAEEQRAREAVHTEHPTLWKMLSDMQIILFCGVYFAIQLTIYAATFWLPAIIKNMSKSLTDQQVGLFNSLPWLIAMISMYIFAAAAARWKFQQAWVACALIVAAVGMFLSTTGGPIFAFVAICFAAVGFKAASALFWPIPQSYLDARIAAAVLALINSIGNLGGLVAPTTFGFLEKHTGSVNGGLYGLAVASILAAIAVFWARTQPKGPVETAPAASAAT